ncbi:hypothetical protein LTR17_000748 [Elasticomyces elasticus]|nr:hypothetical protein LTR17_000748 [Elasticomyces elasticus]
MANIQKLPKVAKDEMTVTKPVVEQEAEESNTTEHETVPLDFSSLTIDEVTQIRKAYQLLRRANEMNGVKRKITLDITYTKGVKVGKTQLFVEYADDILDLKPAENARFVSDAFRACEAQRGRKRVNDTDLVGARLQAPLEWMYLPHCDALHDIVAFNLGSDSMQERARSSTSMGAGSRLACLACWSRCSPSDCSMCIGHDSVRGLVRDVTKVEA